MSIPRSRLLFALLGLLGTLALASPHALAQSDRQLRRENEQLREENEQLKRQVQELTQQIADLNARIARLEDVIKKQATGSTPAPTTAAPTPELVSIDESVPDASPRALMKALVADYTEAMKDIDTGAEGDKQQRIYFRELSRWIRRVNREYKSQIEWHVKVLEGRQRPGEFVLRVIAIDPVHGTELGDPFEVLASGAIVRHLKNLEKRGSVETLILKGALQPMVQLNPDRATAGPFNNPPLVGPHAEFGLSVIATSMVTPEEAQPESPPARRGG